MGKQVTQPALTSGPRLVFAIATHQKTANLALILQLVRPNSGDRVIWLLSETAIRDNLARGITTLLNGKGIVQIPPVEIGDAANQFYTRCFNALSSRDDLKADSRRSVILIMNGGSKAMPAQIDAALRDHFGKVSLAFSDTASPVHYTFWEEDWSDGKEYDWVVPTKLSDILGCNGYVVEPGAVIKLWPDALEPQSLDAKYCETAYINKKHKDAHSKPVKIPARDTPPFADLKDEDKADVGRRISLSLPGNPIINSERAQGVFNSLASIIGKYLREAPTPEDKQEQKEKLGNVFERAVALRVYHWLESNGNCYSLFEAWAGVKIKNPDNPENNQFAELDIVFIFKNGTLITIECKTNPDEVVGKFLEQKGRKDLYGAIGSGFRATMPVYSNLAREPWMETMMRARARAKLAEFRMLDFTLPDQPVEFEWQGSREVVHEKILPFETQLENALRPYRL